ncbi:MAG: response regulator [Betaproteobacteria bacterium]|nr:response regulator [Betaproteobacteria bacterium]
MTISAGRAIEGGREWVTMAVADTGIGLTPAQMGKLFQDFVQADASITRKYGGTGLGLAISRRFCQMMGGDITVASEPGRGSTFTIRVPADCAPPRAVAAPTDAALARTGTAQAGAPTILVVDDDQTVREVMERHLTREGFAVVTANGGQEGLRLARELHPAAITLDVMMPDLDGWTVLAAIKGDPELRGHSGHPDDHRRREEPRLRARRHRLHGQAGRSRAAVGGAAQHLRRGRPPGAAGRRRRPDAARDAAGAAKDGWEVGEAENGRWRWRGSRATRPDIIMLDLMMPEMDGFEFLVELRGRVEWRDIPVVVVTAKDLTAEERPPEAATSRACCRRAAPGWTRCWRKSPACCPGRSRAGAAGRSRKGTQ